MKTLLLMRHAKSSWKDVSRPDHQRSLNKRGKQDAPKMGKFLRGQDIDLDAVLCSTATRAVSTAEHFLDAYGFDGEILYIDDLYASNTETYIATLNRLDNAIDIVMIIGHNPEMDYFLEMSCDAYEHLSTACVALIRFPVDSWQELSEVTPGELLHLWRPREI